MTDIVEPTYSQISAACKAYDENFTPGDGGMDRDAMRLALMAAQKVDPSCYGFMRFGFGCDGVNIQTDSVASRDKVVRWHHDSTTAIPYHEKHTIPELRALRAEVAELRQRTVKDLQDSCEHDWQGQGREGLGGYSEWRCSKCLKES